MLIMKTEYNSTQQTDGCSVTKRGQNEDQRLSHQSIQSSCYLDDDTLKFNNTVSFEDQLSRKSFITSIHSFWKESSVLSSHEESSLIEESVVIEKAEFIPFLRNQNSSNNFKQTCMLCGHEISSCESQKLSESWQLICQKIKKLKVEEISLKKIFAVQISQLWKDVQIITTETISKIIFSLNKLHQIQEKKLKEEINICKKAIQQSRGKEMEACNRYRAILFERNKLQMMISKIRSENSQILESPSKNSNPPLEKSQFVLLSPKSANQFSPYQADSEDRITKIQDIKARIRNLRDDHSATHCQDKLLA